MKLAGGSHLGGIMKVTLDGDTVLIEQSQEVRGTNGTEWKTDSFSLPAESWTPIEKLLEDPTWGKLVESTEVPA
jgi:hypothetical protein